MLQSVLSQTVRHNWVTAQNKNTRNVQACSLFYLLCSRKKERKKPHSSFFFFSFSLQYPHPEAAPPSLVAEPRHPGPPTYLVLQRLSAPPPESITRAHTNSPLRPQPWPSPNPSTRTFKTPCPHGASHTPSQCGLS